MKVRYNYDEKFPYLTVESFNDCNEKEEYKSEQEYLEMLGFIELTEEEYKYCRDAQKIFEKMNEFLEKKYKEQHENKVT